MQSSKGTGTGILPGRHGYGVDQTTTFARGIEELERGDREAARSRRSNTSTPSGQS
jgi:hypothetical protein